MAAREFIRWKQKVLVETSLQVIHNIEHPDLGQNPVEDVDVVHFAIGNADKRGDIATRIQQLVPLDGPMPWWNFAHGNNDRQRSMGRGVQCVKTVPQVDAGGTFGARATLPSHPMWCTLRPADRRHASMSRRLLRRPSASACTRFAGSWPVRIRMLQRP